MQRKPQLQPYRVDLRVGVLPPDAAALGETEWSKAHRVGQTSLCLKPHGGLRLPLPETTVPSAGVADFTITLDVMIDRTDWPAGAVGTLVDGLLEVRDLDTSDRMALEATTTQGGDDMGGLLDRVGAALYSLRHRVGTTCCGQASGTCATAHGSANCPSRRSLPTSAFGMNIALATTQHTQTVQTIQTSP